MYVCVLHISVSLNCAPSIPAAASAAFAAAAAAADFAAVAAAVACVVSLRGDPFSFSQHFAAAASTQQR